MSILRDQLRQELSTLSYEALVEVAIDHAIELDHERKIRLAEKQIYKNVQNRAVKLQEQNKKLENDLAVLCTVFTELLKLIHVSTAKLDACIAAYSELSKQLQHSQEVNVTLNNKIYAPSTERLNSLISHKKEEVSRNEDNTKQNLEQNKRIKVPAERRNRTKGKRAYDCAQLVRWCMDHQGQTPFERTVSDFRHASRNLH